MFSTTSRTYFHDARWLAEHLTTVPFRFEYRWSEHGTRIPDDGRPGCIDPSGDRTNARAVRATLRMEDQLVLLDIERLDEPGQPQPATARALS